MKPFIYSILFFLSITSIHAQNEELVLRNSFEVNENTILNLDIDNATIQFQESNNNTISFAYSIVFSDNSEETKYKVFKNINANVAKDNNVINLEVKNSMYLGELHTLNVDFNIYQENIKEFFKIRNPNKFLYKSKDSVISEINSSLGPDVNDFFKKLKRDNPNKDFGKSSRKFKQKFIIKAPKYLLIKIKALHSKINFNYDLLKPIELNSFNTYLKFKSLQSNKNKFSLHSGIFQSEKVTGGTYFFKDVKKVSIGTISDVKLDTENSKIQIGELGKHVKFNDYSSNFNFYNFSKNFTNFNLVGDYSELSLYKVKESNYEMNVTGYNTALNLNNAKTTFGVSGDKKLTKILEKKPKNNATDKIDIELINGIINIK